MDFYLTNHPVKKDKIRHVKGNIGKLYNTTHVLILSVKVTIN
jgi:hypothetical protein